MTDEKTAALIAAKLNEVIYERELAIFGIVAPVSTFETAKGDDGPDLAELARKIEALPTGEPAVGDPYLRALDNRWVELVGGRRKYPVNHEADHHARGFVEWLGLDWNNALDVSKAYSEMRKHRGGRR